MNASVSSSDVWFDCSEDCRLDAFAGLTTASSDSDSDSVNEGRFIPCIGRGLSVPPLCEVHMPRAAFLGAQMVGTDALAVGKGRGQCLKAQLESASEPSVGCSSGPEPDIARSLIVPPRSKVALHQHQDETFSELRKPSQEKDSIPATSGSAQQATSTKAIAADIPKANE